jgi:hypothetical protein
VSNGESRIPVIICDVRGRRRGGKCRDWDDGNMGRKKVEMDGWMAEVKKDTVTDVKRPEMTVSERYGVREGDRPFHKLIHPSVRHLPTRFIIPQTPSAGPDGIIRAEACTFPDGFDICDSKIIYR